MIKLLLLLFLGLSAPTLAAVPRFSGEPLPRFASIKGGKVNTRFGPAIKYPIKYIYQSQFQPVSIINEYYGWYQIEDIKGDTSWVYKIYLSNKEYAVVKSDGVLVYKKPKTTSKVIAESEKGSIFLVNNCDSKFCEVKTNYDDILYEGFILKDKLFGTD